jgi:hypothetical protein
MNRKTTLLSLKCLVVIAFTQVVNAQQIYTNGPLSTGATSNSLVAAPAGTTWSECQNDTGNTLESNTNAGYGATFNIAATTNNILADDFVVPAGTTWNATSFDIFGYQTGSPATPMPFDQLRIQIYNGDPAAGGTVIAGNLTTNILDAANSGDALMYRIFNSAVPTATATGITRKIWRLRGNLTVSLPPGTYWIAYQAHPTNDLGAFFPPVTVSGSRGLLGWNASQSTVAIPAYTGIFDAGNPATAPDVNQDMPFIINGTVLGLNENDFEASISLSPNPVKDMLSIAVATGTTINAYEIFDVNGKVVKAVNSSTSSITEINVSELSVGNYILKLQSDKGIASKKFIKE